jgi:hypothetical protein
MRATCATLRVAMITLRRPARPSESRSAHFASLS